MPTPEQHALLSASSSHRWINCPPSVRLSEDIPDKTSEYAEAGRVAHAIAELKARRYFLEPMSARTYNARLKKLRADPHYDKGMDASTDAYLEYLQSLAMSFGETAPSVALEIRVEYDDIAPDGFGTSDCIMVTPDTLCVIDYKNGAGVPVEAENNSQMMLYAWGALRLYGPIYGGSIQTVRMAIVQPNAGGVKEWSLSVVNLYRWAEEVAKPAAKLAYSGAGDAKPGDWCRFCPAKAQCSARAAAMLALDDQYHMGLPAGMPGADHRTPYLLTDAEVGECLEAAAYLEAWVKDLKDYALTTILHGGEIAGYKVVEGRGSRDWADLDNAFRILSQQRGVAEALLWERKPVSVAGLEKALGKKIFAQTAGDLVEKKPGKPALVPESDKRPPYNAAAIAFTEVTPNG
ncbi:MAG: DUF2800 domain-containing protein [Oscillospiraceae bacterium]|nr:DUF2800 domain-containing protein [Oscillospiraceae bacterium]